METQTDYTLPAVQKPEEPDEILIMVATVDQGILDNDLISTTHVAQVVGLFREFLVNKQIPFEDGRTFQIDGVEHYTDMTIRAHAKRVQPTADAPQHMELALMTFGHVEPNGIFLSRALAEPYAAALVGKFTRYQNAEYRVLRTWLDAGDKGNVWGECERIDIA